MQGKLSCWGCGSFDSLAILLQAWIDIIERLVIPPLVADCFPIARYPSPC